MPAGTGAGRGRDPGLHQLQIDHLGRVRSTRAELDDPGVPAGALRVAGRQLLDQLLELGLHGLRLGLAGPDPLVLDQLPGEVLHQRLAVRGVAAQLVALLGVAHRRAPGGDPTGYLVVAEIETPRVQRLDHFLDRLLAEVRDRVQLRLRLRHQVADRLHARPLEAVVGPYAQL